MIINSTVGYKLLESFHCNFLDKYSTRFVGQILYLQSEANFHPKNNWKESQMSHLQAADGPQNSSSSREGVKGHLNGGRRDGDGRESQLLFKLLMSGPV